jgi:AP2-associated kinase
MSPQGVACMHYLKPPLLHRDLKVENVLLASSGGYKVCDFGSCSAVKPAPQTAEECKLLEEDIGTHTTLQYRSPEMVDVFRRLPIDEKSDIWALGVLLYKLCYYTTPFEVKGCRDSWLFSMQGLRFLHNQCFLIASKN